MTAETTTPKQQHAILLRGIANRLESEFGEHFTRDTLDHYVSDSYENLRSKAKVMTHIPAFVDRFATQRLRALAKNQGRVVDHVPHVLFVCERNDASSQMAAALFAAKAQGRAIVHSAGVRPAPELLTDSVHALHERNIESIGDFPKPLTTEVEAAADVIVTLDAHDDIEILDGKQYFAWNTSEPAASGLDGYRKLLDELSTKVDELIDQVLPARGPNTHVAFDKDLEELNDSLLDLGELVLTMGRQLASALGQREGADLVSLPSTDDPIDQLATRIAERILGVIAMRQPVAGDLRLILAVNEASLHLERVADGFVDVARAAGASQFGAMSAPLGAMADRAVAMTATAIQSLRDRSVEAARSLDGQDRLLAVQHHQVVEQLVANGLEGVDRESMLMTEGAARTLKRCGEHALDIGEQTVFLVTGERVELGRSEDRGTGGA